MFFPTDKNKKPSINIVEIVQNPIQSLKIKMDAYPLKMVSNTRVSFFIKKIYS